MFTETDFQKSKKELVDSITSMHGSIEKLLTAARTLIDKGARDPAQSTLEDARELLDGLHESYRPLLVQCLPQIDEWLVPLENKTKELEKRRRELWGETRLN